MINVDTNTKAASGTFYADNGVTLGSDNSVLTNLDFVYDDANKKAYINFIHELSTYRDSSTAVGLIEIVNASKIGSLKTMLKIQVDGVDSASGIFISNFDYLKFHLIKNRIIWFHNRCLIIQTRKCRFWKDNADWDHGSLSNFMIYLNRI